MNFQVVLEWSASSMNDYDEMVGIEGLLIARLTKRCKVDGHDFGSNETNIFVHTADPHRTLEEIRTILPDTDCGRRLESPTDRSVEKNTP
jgi:hypothetical protein